MKRRASIRVSWALGIITVATLASPAYLPAQLEPARASFERAVLRGISWYDYWISDLAVTNRDDITVRAVRFRAQWVFFVPSLRVVIKALPGANKSPGSLLSVEESVLFGGSPESALDNYLRIFPPGPGPECLGYAPPRPCVSTDERRPLEQLDLEVTVSGGSQHAGEPTTDDQIAVQAIALAWVMRFYPRSTGSIEMPAFAPWDPTVYLYLSVSGGPNGILVLGRDPDGQCVAGKLLEREESVAHYRHRIRDRLGARFSWEFARSPTFRSASPAEPEPRR